MKILLIYIFIFIGCNNNPVETSGNVDNVYINITTLYTNYDTLLIYHNKKLFFNKTNINRVDTFIIIPRFDTLSYYNVKCVEYQTDWIDTIEDGVPTQVAYIKDTCTSYRGSLVVLKDTLFTIK